MVKAEGGPPAIFKGLWPTLLREVPGNGVMFGVYEYLKQKLAGSKVFHDPASPNKTGQEPFSGTCNS